ASSLHVDHTADRRTRATAWAPSQKRRSRRLSHLSADTSCRALHPDAAVRTVERPSPIDPRRSTSMLAHDGLTVRRVAAVTRLTLDLRQMAAISHGTPLAPYRQHHRDTLGNFFPNRREVLKCLPPINSCIRARRSSTSSKQ